MIVRTITLLALISLVTILPAAGQTNNTNDKARKSATKLSLSTDDIADVKMLSGDKLTGRINAVNADSFDLSDTRSGKSQTIRFSDVKDISKHRKGLGTGAWIAIGAAAAGSAILLSFLVRRICNERAC